MRVKIILAVLIALGGQLTAQTLPSYLPSNGLVGWWPFNGNANDESGNGNHGTVNGATLTADRNGNANGAYFFDYYQYITTPFNLISGNQSRAFCFWMKNGNTTKTITPISYGGNPNQPVLGSQFNVVFNRNETLDQCGCWPTIYQGVGVTADWVYVLHDSNVIDNQWHFYVFQLQNVGDNFNDVKIYIDGQLLTSSIIFNYNENGLNTVNTDNSTGLTIGKSWADASYPSSLIMRAPSEYIDDIAIYNRALTQEEITALYTGSSSNNNGGGGSGSTAGTPAESVPAGIPYQAVIRDNAGAALVNTPVTVRFTLHENTTSGTTEYQETQSLTTNSLGLINTQFGAGTATQGTFAGINWSNTTKFIQVEANTGAGYVDMGTQQMMSVPFAIKSNEANKVKNAGLPVYADNAAALAGGLVAGEMYRTAAGILMIVF